MPVTVVTAITIHGISGLPMVAKVQQQAIFSATATATATARKASETANMTIVAAVASNTVAGFMMASGLAAASASTVWGAVEPEATEEEWQVEYHHWSY